MPHNCQCSSQGHGMELQDQGHGHKKFGLKERAVHHWYTSHHIIVLVVKRNISTQNRCVKGVESGCPKIAKRAKIFNTLI